MQTKVITFWKSFSDWEILLTKNVHNTGHRVQYIDSAVA